GARASHREFEAALEAQGVPAYVYKGLGFFDSDEIKDLSALIRFLANPSSDLRAAAFLRSRLVRLSDAALARLAPAVAASLTGPEPPAMAAPQSGDRPALELARPQPPGRLAPRPRTPPPDLPGELLPPAAHAL